MTDFHELYDGERLSPGEEARLRRVHELLLEAGAPPELPAALAHPPAPERGQVIRLRGAHRGRAVAFAAAATLAAAVFGGGYLAGHETHRSAAALSVVRVVRIHGEAASGVIRLGAVDRAGNWTMVMTVRGLPQLASNRRYELWLTRDGKRVAACGVFKTHGSATTVWFNVPYRIHRTDGWVVTKTGPDEAGPGTVVMQA
jgi:hypothetical protein